MACRMIGAKQLSEPMLEYCQLDHKDNLQWNCKWKSYIFIQENTFENVVCKISAIWPRLQYINTTRPEQYGWYFGNVLKSIS